MEWIRNTVWKDWAKENNIEIPQGIYPLLAIEGPDGGGKSTIINILLDIIKHSFLLHTSAPVKGSSKEYYEELLNKSVDLINVLNQPMIIDRFHIGESVYGSIFRGYQLDYSKLEQTLKPKGMKVVYVTANESVLAERIRKRGDWYITEKDIAPILRRHEEEMAKTTLPVFILDTSNDITPDDIKELVTFIFA